MNPLAAVPLFFATAAAELGGCYLVFLWMRGARSPMLLLGAALSLATFAWMLSLHPNAGRAYAAYGGVYIVSAVAWGRFVDGHSPDRWDLLGAAVCFLGTLIIVFGPRP
jgi:small multidrug resistance family-3 protein